MIFSKRPVLVLILVVLSLLSLPSLAQDTTSVHIYEDPSNVDTDTDYDPDSDTYEENTSVGGFNIGDGSIFNFDEYNEYRQQQMLENYWRKLAGGSTDESRTGNSKLNDVAGQLTEGLIPSLKIDKENIGKIFGPDLIDLSLRGSLELDFQVKKAYRGNLSIPKSRRTNISFKMDNDIQVNADGKIGNKLSINTDYFTKALFNRRNLIDLKYEGEEDEIIKLVQLGNVNLPLPSSLITGSQDLFGIKTTWQFGPTRVTGVFSEQKSESRSFQIENGGQKNEFEFYADKYDDNRHYFIAPYFYNHYDEALARMPYVASEIDITKIEVWVTNTRARIDDARDILALTHIGDNINDIATGENVVGSADAIVIPNNGNNDLNPKDLEAFDSDFRTFHQLNSATGNKGIKIIEDYEKIEKARKLSPNEYTFNPKLGFISLNQKLRQSEVLAVAFQYTYRGEVFQVGEFADQLISPNTLMLKLLKPSIIDVEHPSWKLMMKNVYSLNAYQVNKDDFVLNILYKQPESGSKLRYIPEQRLDSMQLIELLNLDNLNANGDLSKDGYFDFISNPALTIDAQKGKVYLPSVEPFGEFIKAKILEKNPALSTEVAESYMYPELYSRTKADAEQQPEKNRYLLKGSYKSEYGSEISLNAYNLQPGSVKLRQGSEQLTEGVDFIVDYSLGRVTIVNEGKLNSGTPIDVSVESQSGFLQSKRFMGLRVDHTVNENLILGGSFLNLKQAPITNKINYGEEPINNSVWGIDGTFQKEVPKLTSLVNKIPFLKSEVKSNVFATAEFAQFLPGHPNIIDIDEGGTAYIDDFENGQTEISILYPTNWKLASIPLGTSSNAGDLFPEATIYSDIRTGFNRADLAWYVIRDEFYGRSAPDNIEDNDNILDDPYQRDVRITEIFENKDLQSNQIDRIRPLNLSFDPTQPGPYNFDVEPTTNSAGINADGSLKSPSERWGGIMQRINSPDWEASNIEYIEFWMMDPYITNSSHNGGDLYLNIGSISEDVLQDSRKSFENGLPTAANPSTVDTTSWGLVSNSQILVRSFDNADGNIQDVGFDGLTDEQERDFVPNSGDIQANFLKRVDLAYGQASGAYTSRFDDPALDNYQHFYNQDYDDNKADIITRYSKYNRSENNTYNSFIGNGSTVPNVEDIDADNTLNENQSYYQYHIDLRPENLNLNHKYITQVLENKGPNQDTKWFLFRVPIRDFQSEFGGINDFKSIRFMRMFLHGFEEKVNLRFATLSMVRGNWRQYDLVADPTLIEDPDASFEVASVNIEENGLKSPIPYVLPPGIQREQIQGNQNSTFQNEQSLSLKVCNLDEGASKIAYKNVGMNLNNYNKIKMFVHAEKVVDKDIIEDGEVSMFVRLGTDYSENYYEYEIPLEMTPWSETSPRAIWPENNELEIEFQKLIDLKLERNRAIVASGGTGTPVTYGDRYSKTINGKNLYVKGNPNVADTRSIMIGVRNTSKTGDKCAEIWVNELRLVGFDEESSVAFRGQFKTNLADFADVNISGSYMEAGFGSLAESISQRRQETLQDFSANTTIKAGKLFPENWGVSLPVYYGITNIKSTPKYNPLDQDVRYKDAINNASTSAEKDRIKKSSVTQSKYKSFNVTNVGLNPKGKGKTRFYSPSNVKVSYSRTELDESSPEIEYNRELQEQGQVAYNFTSRAKGLEPFKKLGKKSKSKLLEPIRKLNLNPIPKNINFTYFVDRRFKENLIRPIIYLGEETPGGLFSPIFSQSLNLDSQFGMKFDLTRSLKLSFQSNRNGVFADENQRLRTKNQDIWEQIWTGGTARNYHQTFNATYKLPLQFIAPLKWISANAKYNANYDWIGANTITQSFGNTIQNTRELQLNTTLDFSKLYKTIPYVKKAYGGRGKSASQQKKKLKDKAKKKADKSKKKIDKLTEKGNSILEKATNTADSTQVESSKPDNTLPENIQDAIKKEEEKAKDIASKFKDKEKKLKERLKNSKKKLSKPVDAGIRLLTAVKKVDLTYRRSEGITLPGFRPETGWFGGENLSSPGLGFLFGQQEQFGASGANILDYANEKGWIIDTVGLNTQFSNTYQEHINVKAIIEPIKRFKINLDANRMESLNTTMYFRPTENGGDPVRQNRTEQGNFNMSILSINTAFKDQNQIWQTFLDNRQAIAERLAEQEIEGPIQYDANGYPVGFGETSQEVLIPSFIAAYTGKNIKTQSLTKFPKIPMPNWKITYDGLRNLKFLKKRVKRVSLTSGYSSVYTVGSYNRNLLYDEANAFQYGLDDNIDFSGNFIPKYQINQVNISEQFNPLIKVDVTLKNNMSLKTEFKKSRNLTLNIDNSQLLQENLRSYVIGMSYRINDVKIFKGELSKSKIPRTLEASFDVNYNYRKSLVRNIYDEGQQVNSGNKVLGFNVELKYTINENLGCTFYFDRNSSEAFILSSFPTKETLVGFKIKYTFNQ